MDNDTGVQQQQQQYRTSSAPPILCSDEIYSIDELFRTSTPLRQHCNINNEMQSLDLDDVSLIFMLKWFLLFIYLQAVFIGDNSVQQQQQIMKPTSPTLPPIRLPQSDVFCSSSSNNNIVLQNTNQQLLQMRKIGKQHIYKFYFIIIYILRCTNGTRIADNIGSINII
jgi:hypothetical protein